MTTRQRLRDRADKLYQDWVRATYKHCLLCSKPVSCGHHFIAKSNSLALRYYKPNYIPICVYHHSLIGCQPSVPNAQITLIRGKEWLRNLLNERKREVRDTVGFYKEAIKQYEQDN